MEKKNINARISVYRTVVFIDFQMLRMLKSKFVLLIVEIFPRFFLPSSCVSLSFLVEPVNRPIEQTSSQ